MSQGMSLKLKTQAVHLLPLLTSLGNSINCHGICHRNNQMRIPSAYCYRNDMFQWSLTQRSENKKYN